MSTMGSLGDEAYEKLLSEVRTHEHAERIAAFCFDVLSAQAEGRALYAGKRLMRVRASNHRLSRTQAECSVGNVLSILERGPERAAEWTLIGAFAVRGLDQKFAESSAAERRELMERFARHADWLELSTPYAPYRFVPALVSEAGQDALVEVLEGFVLAPADGPSIAAHRARAVLRLHVLSNLDRPATAQALARIAESDADPWVRALAGHALGGDRPPVSDDLELRGVWGRVPKLSVARVLQYVTGVTLLSALMRFLAYAFGLERSARVKLEPAAVHVHSEVKLFGRTLRVSDASYALRDVECALREVSMPTFQVLAGALALVLGVVLGTVWVSDALARGDSELLAVGATALAVGAGLDLLFAGWGRLRRDRAGFELYVDREPVATLRKVDPERAQRLVEQIARQRTSRAS
jgi:hypothetical protein